MKSKIFIVCLLIIFSLSFTSYGAKLSANVSAIDITPPLEMKYTLGGYGERMNKPAEAIHDHIWAKALALQMGGKKYLIVTLDLLGLPSNIKGDLIKRIPGMGWSLENIMLLPSHSHGSLEMAALNSKNILNNPNLGIFQPELLTFMLDKLESLVKAADRNYQPVNIATASKILEGLNRNRRNDPDIDKELIVTRIDLKNGKPLAVLVNWTAHPTFLGGQDMLVSAEWPGYLKSNLQDLIGQGVTAMYFNGSEGDQSTVLNSDKKGYEKIQIYGKIIADKAFDLYKEIRPKKVREFNYSYNMIPLPEHVAHPSFMKTGGEEYGLNEKTVKIVMNVLGPKEVGLGAIRIDDLLISGIPGEMTAVLGRKVKSGLKKEGVKYVAIGGLANEWISYILSRDQYLLGEGYESSVSFYGPDLGDVISDGAIKSALPLTQKKMIDRRDFLKISGLIASGTLVGFNPATNLSKHRCRSFSLCTNTATLKSNPDFLDLIANSGVTDVWMPYFINGYRPYPIEDIVLWKGRFEKKGITVQIVSVPLGHPGNSLGGLPEFESTPKHWPRGVDIDGNKYSGTSVHGLITADNISVIQKIGKAGFTKLFLDDDFRLARTPGKIGGCFCEQHQQEFLDKYGYGEKEWIELKQNIKSRELNSLSRNWIDFNCDILTNSFRAQQKAFPEVKLGIMVMYLGSEKAGIRLSDYKGSLMRVGELMFDDKSMTPVKGKTDELFSALFHRRFVTPELAYSETTAYPADKLSAKNMAAKLHISTIADVRNTMMMSGLEPFPFTHWSTLAPAMKKAASLHQKVAGHKPNGPFKHYWGESSRLVGDDKPYSLFLASGIPFEVTETPADNGWTFLSDFEMNDVVSQKLKSKGTTFVDRGTSDKKMTGNRLVAENLNDIFAFKHEIISQLSGIPYVVEDKPVVCTWYPKIKIVLLWNLSESKESFTLKLDDRIHTLEINGLDAEIVNL